MYFRRALKLNRNYLSAWTLMGHEYVEMKNTPAAIGEPPLRHKASACAGGGHPWQNTPWALRHP